MTDELIVLVAGNLVDVESAEVRKDELVIIRGERIQEVRAASEGMPDGATVIDLGDKTLVPGMIDCHAHMIGELDTGQGYAGLVTTTAAREVMTGVRNARDTLLAGFTTVRDVGTFHAFTDCALRDAIDGGWVLGPRMLCSGAYVTVPSGGGDVTGLAPNVDAVLPRELRFGVSRGVDEVRDAVRRILHGGADMIKVIATGAVLTEGTTPGAPEFTEEEIRAAVDEAALYGAFVAAHAHGAEGIKRAVRAGVRSVEHGSLMDDESIELMAERGTYLVADIYCGDWIEEQGRKNGWSPNVLRKNEETTEAQREGFGKAVTAGVKIAYGTDSGVYPHAFVGRQLPYMVRFGMTPMQGLQAATLVAAKLMGWDDRVGSISPGKFADIVAVSGDPLEADLETLSRPSFVMKGGKIYRS